MQQSDGIITTIGLILALSCPAPGVEAFGGREVTVRVYNYAKAPSATLAKAQTAAEGVIRGIGIKTVWLDCTRSVEEPGSQPICAKPSGPTHLVLNVIPRSMKKPWSESRLELGSAVLDPEGYSRYAYVFFDRVKEMAKLNNCYLSTLLAYAMVHEIGHLLLGSGSHASSGIMTASWKRAKLRKAQTGGLRFNEAQARRMRAEVDERSGRVLLADKQP